MSVARIGFMAGLIVLAAGHARRNGGMRTAGVSLSLLSGAVLAAMSYAV